MKCCGRLKHPKLWRAVSPRTVLIRKSKTPSSTSVLERRAAGTRSPGLLLEAARGPHFLLVQPCILSLRKAACRPVYLTFLWEPRSLEIKRELAAWPYCHVAWFFCGILIVLHGPGMMVTLNGYSTILPPLCVISWGGGRNATKFHFKQKYVAPAADWGLALICKFLQIQRMFCQQQCNSWDTAKEQLFIEYIPFRLPSAQIQGTLFLEKTLMYLLGIALYTHRSGALAQRSALAGFSSESWICYMTLG